MTKREFVKRLRKARALVVRGWWQGAWSNFAERPDGNPDCFCAWGALAEAGLRDYVTEYPDGETVGLVTWNDRPGRTKAEVVAMFDNSIAALTAR